MLAAGDPEKTWGWGTPAGKLRAKRRAELIIAGARLEAGKRALEIGCGTGLFTRYFAETGAEIVAVDVAPELLEKARQRDLPAGRVTLLVRRFEDCEVEGPFDAVVGSSVLHHLELDESLARIHDLLKPGGFMSFAEPNMMNPQVFFERKFSRLPLFSHVSPDETAFFRHRLRNKLRQASFVRVEIEPFDWLHPAVPERFIPAVLRIGRLLESLPGIRELAGSLLIVARRPSQRQRRTDHKKARSGKRLDRR